VLWFSLFLLAVFLVGCDRDTVLKPFGYDRAKLLRMTVSEEDETFARAYLENIRQRRFEQIENDLDPGASNSNAHDNLAKMAAVFPQRAPASTKLVVARVIHHADSSTTSNLVFEYGFALAAQPIGGTSDLNSGEWLLAEVVVQTVGSKRTVERLTLTPIPEPLEAVNAFTLEGKGFSQNAGLLLAIFVVGFSTYAFVQCIRAKGLRKRWVWLVLILIGVCKFTVNWTTGEWFFTPLAIDFIPSQMFCTPYGPWIVSVGIPLGAVAFLLREQYQQRPNATGD
jgi:hypothetical protein